MAITVHLFYVPDKSLVEFVVSAYKSHNQVLGNIRRRFGAQFSAVYTQDAKTQLDDLRTVFEGQILLVATSPYTRPQPYSPLGFKFYQGEESNYIHPSLPKKPWAELTDAEKKGHIVSIGANRPETRNTLRISEPYAAVVAELDALKKVNAAQLNATYSLPMSYNEWELRMVASVAILAKATPGQGHILKDIIKDVVGSQGALTEQHVVRTITRIYERAGLISRPEEKDKAKRREHEKRRRAVRKAEAKSKKEAEAADALGEEAAEAAYPRGRKTGQGRQEVDELAEKLSKTKTSRPSRLVVPEEDESE